MNEISSKSLKIPAEFAEELPADLYQSEITLQTGPDTRIYSQRKGGSLGMEQLRMLQVHLTEINSQRPFKRLLVTSATRGEGKTHIATNLALALASEGHQRVLLIDADLPNLERPIPNDENHLHFGTGQTEAEVTLQPGPHKLQLLFADAHHIPHEPPLYSKPISVFVGTCRPKKVVHKYHHNHAKGRAASY